jgi:hypothetical protein
VLTWGRIRWALSPLVLVGFLVLATPANAAPPESTIGLAVQPSATAYPTGTTPLLHVHVINASASACGLAADPDLTISVVSATRDGQPLVPQYVQTLPIDGAIAGVARHTTSVAPQQALTFDLDAGQAAALPASVALDDGTALAALWPVDASGQYAFTLAYAMPPAAGATACAGSSGPVTITFTVGPAGSPSSRVWLPIGIVAGILVVLIVVALLIWRSRRGRRTGAAAAAAVVLLAAFGVVAVDAVAPVPANAGIIYGPQPTGPIYSQFQACLLQILSFDPGLSHDLTGPGSPNVTVYPWYDTATHSKKGSRDSLISWDPNDRSPFVGETSGAVNDPCMALYHELNHARDHANDSDSSQECDDTGVLVDEVKATIAENRFRAAQKPPLPQRTTYDGKKIPASLDGCTPPKTPPDARVASNDPGICRGLDGPCGGDNGDPHLSTLDGYRFDLQAVGEFVLVHSSAGDMDIQARQSAFTNSREVAVNTAVAMRVGSQKLGFYLVNGRMVVHQNGSVVPVALGTATLTGGVRVNRIVDPARGDSFAVSWTDGSVAWVQQVGVWGLAVSVQPRAARSGTLTGVLGPFNGDRSDDVSTVDGHKLAQPPSFDDLYHTYAPGWRVAAANSLFDYDPGKSTKDYTDLSFPDKPSDVDSLSATGRSAAEAACRLLGVTDPALLANCIIDVANTGQPMFAVDAGRVQAAFGNSAAGPTQTLSVTKPGSSLVATFTGKAGQRAYIDVTATTLPDMCGVPALRDPSGITVGLGCLKGGTGYLDGTLLKDTGTYQIVIAPGNATGSITFRVIVSTDMTAPITPDGPPATATVTTPGQQGQLTFTAPTDEKVFVQILHSTVPAGCGTIEIASPTGVATASGCTTADGTGLIDTTTLPAGPYEVLLDPEAGNVGSATVKLTVVHDQIQPIVLNGQSVLATVSQAGGQSRLTFTGKAGQMVTVEGTGSTVPPGCGVLLLVDPSGGTLAEGCVDADTSASMGPTTLPADGTYAVVVDPPDIQTGSTQLRVHT